MNFLDEPTQVPCLDMIVQIGAKNNLFWVKTKDGLWMVAGANESYQTGVMPSRGVNPPDKLFQLKRVSVKDNKVLLFAGGDIHSCMVSSWSSFCFYL